jgi:hypothetical protein
MIRFSIPKIVNKISKIEDAIIMNSDMLMETIDSIVVDNFCETILDTLFKRNTLFDEEASMNTLQKIMTPFRGEELDRELLRDITRIIVSAEECIKKGEDFPFWSPNGLKGWGLFYVKDINRSTFDKKRFECVIECKSGHPVGQIIRRSFSEGYCVNIIRESGGSRYEKYPPVYLGGLFFAASVAYKNAAYKFDDFYTTSSISKHNKNLLKERTKPCAKNMTKSCDLCFMGREMCKRSPHAINYEAGLCINKHKGYIANDGYCMTCLRKGRTARQNK